MKLRVISASFALMSSVLYSGSSMAFGLPSIPGISGSGSNTGSSSSVDVGSLTNQQAQMLVAVSASLRNLFQAQEMMADALGLKEDAASAAKGAADLANGDLTGKDQMVKKLENTAKVQQDIDEQQAKGQTLSAESKAEFTKALLPYGAGSAQLVIVAKKAVDTGKSLTSTFDPTVLYKLDSMIYLVKQSPALISNFGGSTGNVIKFASSQGIDTEPLKKQVAGMGF
jgi:hypothetical protein